MRTRTLPRPCEPSERPQLRARRCGRGRSLYTLTALSICAQRGSLSLSLSLDVILTSLDTYSLPFLRSLHNMRTTLPPTARVRSESSSSRSTTPGRSPVSVRAQLPRAVAAGHNLHGWSTHTPPPSHLYARGQLDAAAYHLDCTCAVGQRVCLSGLRQGFSMPGSVVHAPTTAWTLLSQQIDTLILVGDSVMRQLYLALQRLQSSHRRVTKRALKLEFAPWMCGAQSEAEMHELFELTLSHAAKGANPNRSAVLISLGAWYNLVPRSQHTCQPHGLCSPFSDNAVRTALSQPTSYRFGNATSFEVARLKGLRTGGVQRGGEAARERQPARRGSNTALDDKFPPWRPQEAAVRGLESLRFSVCLARQLALAATPVNYVRDLQGLSTWVVKHRTMLPKHVIWMDPLPQHFGSAGTFSRASFFQKKSTTTTPKAVPQCASTRYHELGEWRANIAERVWRQLAPDVPRLSAQSYLASRWDAHPSSADCTHWCANSTAWRYHVASVLTKVLAEVGKTHHSG